MEDNMTCQELTHAICVKLRKAKLTPTIQVVDESEEITVRKRPDVLYVSAKPRPAKQYTDSVLVKIGYATKETDFSEGFGDIEQRSGDLFRLLENIELREGRTEPHTLRGFAMEFRQITNKCMYFFVQYRRDD
jgi:hypothetical protein